MGATANTPITIEGKTYHYLAPVDSFTPDVGREFQMENKPIAVFLHSGKFFAMAGRCPHRGGPIALGKITGNHLECPWHEWRFDVSSGKVLQRYCQDIAYYEVAVQNENVYVNILSMK